MGQRELTRVRKILLAMPDVVERMSHGAPCFYVKGRKALCRFHDKHRGDDRISLWCPLPDPLRAALLASDDEQFFAPRPSAGGIFSNWIGIHVDEPKTDWTQIAEVLQDAYREVAPRPRTARGLQIGRGPGG